MIEANLDRVWAALMTGAQPGRTPFTVLQLATSGLDGAPKVRSVILRGADAERDAVSFFTDVRPRRDTTWSHGFSWSGYDEEAGFQIRLEGKATIRHRGPGKGCGLGGLSITYPRALPASAAFREPDLRSSRSCAS
ncbi:hypothetical protein [Roseiarcus fermentans]|uniref:hypothetical protein n=1 Tax=Roseiarcus fermentans TaxID=1473586 RepID=UPI000DE9F6CF|nr:hypothetical protein [Roseiarcus fermentans]